MPCIWPPETGCHKETVPAARDFLSPGLVCRLGQVKTLPTQELPRFGRRWSPLETSALFKGCECVAVDGQQKQISLLRERYIRAYSIRMENFSIYDFQIPACHGDGKMFLPAGYLNMAVTPCNEGDEEKAADA